MEATLDCLQEHGYHNSSLSMILNRAGASRGAWNHHFPSKKDLVIAAVKSLLNQAIERCHAEVQPIKQAGTFQALLDFMWNTFYTGRYRDVWLEFMTACRTDSELRDGLQSTLEQFQQAVNDLWQENVVATHDDADAVRLMNLTASMLRGMSLQSASYDRPDEFSRQREQWAHFLESTLRIEK